jgi:uncharacterized protein (TIGR03032 family)
VNLLQSGEPSSARLSTIDLTQRGAFVDVLARLGLTLVVSLRPHHVAFIGAVGGTLTAHVTPVNWPMGLAVSGGKLAVSTKRSVIVFANVARLAASYPGRTGHFDAFFVPRQLHFTGECLMHDIAFDGAAIIGANTNFSCVCRVDGAFSFTPVWQPPFITQLRPEDRCHLNGMAWRDGQLRYVTALSQSNAERGWRATPDDAGVLIDTETNRILADTLCMPHSPRLIGDKLFVLNGGKGEVLHVDRSTGDATVFATLPGFTHGLCEHGGYLFVGMSKNRDSRKDNPPPIAAARKDLVCGIAMLDAKTGALLGAVEIADPVTEVYDIQPLSGIRTAGMQDLETSDGFAAIDTPNTVIWTKRKDS